LTTTLCWPDGAKVVAVAVTIPVLDEVAAGLIKAPNGSDSALTAVARLLKSSLIDFNNPA
jgi:hypothetical protein